MTQNQPLVLVGWDCRTTWRATQNDILTDGDDYDRGRHASSAGSAVTTLPMVRRRIQCHREGHLDEDTLSDTSQMLWVGIWQSLTRHRVSVLQTKWSIGRQVRVKPISISANWREHWFGCPYRLYCRYTNRHQHNISLSDRVTTIRTHYMCFRNTHISMISQCACPARAAWRGSFQVSKMQNRV